MKIPCLLDHKDFTELVEDIGAWKFNIAYDDLLRKGMLRPFLELALPASETFRIATHPTTPAIEALILWKALVNDFYLKRLHDERRALDVAVILSITTGKWTKEERLESGYPATIEEELAQRESLLKKLLRLEREGRL